MLMTVADAARELTNRLRGEPSDTDAALIAYGATILELEDSLKKALLRGTLRPRSAFTGAYANEHAFLGLHALVSLDDAIEALKPDGYAFPIAAEQATPKKTSTEEPDAQSWQEMARSFASTYLDAHRKNDLFPSQADVCEHVANEMRRLKIYGPHASPLSDKYIRRNAIQGEWWKKNKQ